MSMNTEMHVLSKDSGAESCWNVRVGYVACVFPSKRDWSQPEIYQWGTNWKEKEDFNGWTFKNFGYLHAMTTMRLPQRRDYFSSADFGPIPPPPPIWHSIWDGQRSLWDYCEVPALWEETRINWWWRWNHWWQPWPLVPCPAIYQRLQFMLVQLHLTELQADCRRINVVLARERECALWITIIIFFIII